MTNPYAPPQRMNDDIPEQDASPLAIRQEHLAAECSARGLGAAIVFWAIIGFFAYAWGFTFGGWAPDVLVVAFFFGIMLS